MPISRDTNLLDSGTYQLGTRASAPTDLQALRDGPYSLHHILPYRYPLFVGFLAETYATKYGGNTPNWPGGSTDQIAKQTAGILNVVSRFGSEQHTIPSKFAWMGPNLFQGPSGNLRVDDPGSNPEERKPISYRPAVWDALMKVADKVNGLVSTLGSNNQGYTVTTTKPLTVGDLEDLLNLLSPIADVGHGNALSFTDTDWIVMSTSDPGFSKDFLPNAMVSVAVKQRFSALPRNKIQNFRPSYSGATTDLTPRLWRLRQSTEPIPTDVIKGPRLQ
ncbi:MAG TPA: hypothetical protein VHS97_09115 [Isosphaeraceae bacterium]|jgi:hypothetical protein|nr:hypothetical protein [Isosphaeraceae bacterium]